jgi:uncharacterized membrane protein
VSILPFIFLVSFLIAFIQLGALSIAFGKLGLSQHSAYLLLFASLFGSMINLPLFTMKAQPVPLDQVPEQFRAMVREAMKRFRGRTVIAINVGGGLIPIAFSIYLLAHNPLPLDEVVTAIALVSIVCYVFSRPIPGLGIGMPIFVAPVTAALVALAVDSDHAAPLAYICGTLGVLIGADLMRTRSIRDMGVPIAAIGGAGTFDGIFLAGIVAVLLA